MTTKKRAKFRLRSKPKAPRKRALDARKSIDFYPPTSVQHIIESIRDRNPYIDLEDVALVADAEVESDYYGEYTSYATARVWVEWHQEETEEEYEEYVLKPHQKKLEKYNQWYEENKEAIERELELRAVEEAEEYERKKVRRKEKAKKDLKKLEKKLERLRKYAEE